MKYYLAVLLAAISFNTYADAQYRDWATVVQSTPVYQSVQPAATCRDVPVQNQQVQSGSPWGAVIGGAVGTGLGSMVGKGKGNVAAMVVGGITGAVVGNQVGSNNTQQMVRECTQPAPVQNIVGYDTEVQYDGRQFIVRTMRQFFINQRVNVNVNVDLVQ